MVWVADLNPGALNAALTPYNMSRFEYLLVITDAWVSLSGKSWHPIMVSKVRSEVVNNLTSSAMVRLSSKFRKMEGDWKKHLNNH